MKKLGFIGCGGMASAIINGLINSKFIDNSEILASTFTEKSANLRKEELKIEVLTNNKHVAENSEIIILATKPKQIENVLKEIKE